jgi:nitrous oxidase accessory protein
LIKTLLQQKKPPIDWEQVMEKSVALMLVLVLAASSIVFVLPVKGEARSIIVPDDYPTIQAAVNAASSGDTVFVRKGTYKEPTLRINKALSLTGEDAVATCIILSPPWIEYENPIPFDYSQIPHYDDAIRIDANDVKLSGFTINNTIKTNGGFCVISGSRVQIIGNIILNNLFHFGGGYDVFALNTITCGVEFFGGGYCTIAGNTMIGGSIWIGIGCPANVIYGNTIVGDTEGIAVGGNENIVTNNTVTNSKFGIGAAADASDNTFYANMVINNTLGLRIAAEGDNNTFYANYVSGNAFGADVRYYFPVGDNNILYRNNFIDNIEQVDTNSTYVLGDGSHWTAYKGGYFDNGAEGNYWNDYSGVDANGDGVGDTPYVIDESRRDSFPRMNPFDIYAVDLQLPPYAYRLPYPLPDPLPLPILEITPPEEATPTIETTSPEVKLLAKSNQTYNQSSVEFVFTVNKPFNWIGYSLDGEKNRTVTGNFTLRELTSGLHNLTVYAKDTFGNEGASETVSFTVEVPFPITLVIAPIATTAAIGVGFIVYLKKRNHQEEKVEVK